MTNWNVLFILPLIVVPAKDKVAFVFSYVILSPVRASVEKSFSLDFIPVDRHLHVRNTYGRLPNDDGSSVPRKYTHTPLSLEDLVSTTRTLFSSTKLPSWQMIWLIQWCPIQHTCGAAAMAALLAMVDATTRNAIFFYWLLLSSETPKKVEFTVVIPNERELLVFRGIRNISYLRGMSYIERIVSPPDSFGYWRRYVVGRTVFGCVLFLSMSR